MESNYVLHVAIGVGCGICIGWFLKSRIFSRKTLSQGTKIVEDLTDKNTNGIFSDHGEYKMVFVVRTDLKMGKGKAAAQCSHAAVGLYRKASRYSPSILKTWETFGQPKVCLKTDTEESLLELSQKANTMGLTTCLIHDAGRTQIAAGSTTVLGVGPAPADLIDQVTGHLKLF